MNKHKVAPTMWAIATALASIAWAISAYWMVREQQRAQVELARLEVEAKKLVSCAQSLS